MAFKRNLLLLGIFVLLGALTTFGIAWVSVLYVARAGWSDEAVEREWVGRWRRDEVDYVVCTMSQTGITQVTANRVCESRLSQEGFEKFYPPIDQWLPRWAFPRAARTASVRPTCEVHLTETASGWPLPALVSSQLWSLTPLGDFKTKFVRGGVSVD